MVQKTTKDIESYVNEMTSWSVNLYCKPCRRSSVERTFQLDLPKTLEALFLFVEQSVLAGLSLPCVDFHNAQIIIWV
jgi:hypothetical protein